MRASGVYNVRIDWRQWIDGQWQQQQQENESEREMRVLETACTAIQLIWM